MAQTSGLNSESADGSNNYYIFTDDSNALGTKCITGCCYLITPIWVMVRLKQTFVHAGLEVKSKALLN